MYQTHETLLEIAKKALVFEVIEKRYPSETWIKDVILQVNLHYLRCAAINIHTNTYQQILLKRIKSNLSVFHIKILYFIL